LAIDSNSVTALATCLYGGATLLLVIQIWRDRVQRERHFKAEAQYRKLGELHRAFYEAWGYWVGHSYVAGDIRPDATQVGRQFEAVGRLECLLRLSGYEKEANDLGLAVRTNLQEIREKLAIAGVALGVLPAEYRRATTNPGQSPTSLGIRS
jgi:hypothetical protein